MNNTWRLLLSKNLCTENVSLASDEKGIQITRRVFLKSTAASFFASSLLPIMCCKEDNEIIARFGIVTDIHYADTETRGTRFYKESAKKLKECIELMNAEKLDFLVELGDFKDQDEPTDEKRTIRYLQTIEGLFQQFNGQRYHVLGNHDIDSISKVQFLTNVENTNIPKDRSYYSFDSGKLHFIILDANFRSDGSDYDHGNFDWKDANIPPDELLWL